MFASSLLTGMQGCESSSFELIFSFLKIFLCQNFSFFFYFQPIFGILPGFHSVFPRFLHFLFIFIVQYYISRYSSDPLCTQPDSHYIRYTAASVLKSTTLSLLKGTG